MPLARFIVCHHLLDANLRLRAAEKRVTVAWSRAHFEPEGPVSHLRAILGQCNHRETKQEIFVAWMLASYALYLYDSTRQETAVGLALVALSRDSVHHVGAWGGICAVGRKSAARDIHLRSYSQEMD